MDLKKNEKRTLLVLLITLAAFSVIAFAVPFHKNGVFWLAYLFGVIAIIAQAFILKTAFGKEEGAKSKFYGFPIARVGVIYLVVQLILSFIFMRISLIAPVWLAIVLFLVLLALAAVGFIATDAVRDEVERQEIKITTNTNLMKSLRTITAGLPAQCSDPEVKKALEKLAEDFRFSDPVSKESLAAIESQLELSVSQLQAEIRGGNLVAIQAACELTKVMLAERNRICKADK